MRNSRQGTVTLFVIGAIVLLGGLVVAGIACAKLEKIHPGHVGVSVKKCEGGGVSDDPIPTGYYWRTLFCEDVVEYPISMQSLILTKNPHEGTGGTSGNEVDQSITVTSSEGLGIETDVALNFTLDAKKVPSIYSKWRDNIENIEHKYIRQTVREGLQNTFAKYSAEELYSTKKETARAEVQTFLENKIGPFGFMISQFTINRIEPPQQVITAINAKVAMIQQAQQSQQEVKKKEAEAAQAVAVARGQADARKAQAEGEAAAIEMTADAQAKANLTLSKSVTPELIEYVKAQKWSGNLPQVTGQIQPMMNVGK
jgi:regulator of protease activity HflC (stomatin/prohibitin superfamily)